MFEIHRNCMHGQWKNCDFVLHIGSVALVYFRDGCNPNRSATVIELFTPKRWFRFRAGRSPSLADRAEGK